MTPNDVLVWALILFIIVACVSAFAPEIIVLLHVGYLWLTTFWKMTRR